MGLGAVVPPVEVLLGGPRWEREALLPSGGDQQMFRGGWVERGLLLEQKPLEGRNFSIFFQLLSTCLEQNLVAIRCSVNSG